MSSRLVRKQVLITQEQNQRLKALAAETGCSEAELFREAVTQRLDQAHSPDWKTAFRRASGIWADRTDEDIAKMMSDLRGGWKRRQLRHEVDSGTE